MIKFIKIKDIDGNRLYVGLDFLVAVKPKTYMEAGTEFSKTDKSIYVLYLLGGMTILVPKDVGEEIVEYLDVSKVVGAVQ